MSFEVLLIGAADSTLLPRMTDLLWTFEGHVVRMPGDFLVVGSDGGAACEIAGTWGPETDPQQPLITIREPISAAWLWEGVLEDSYPFVHVATTAALIDAISNARRPRTRDIPAR
jgi:hypothetical protein